jgi:hypothetical protein
MPTQLRKGLKLLVFSLLADIVAEVGFERVSAAAEAAALNALALRFGMW